MPATGSTQTHISQVRVSLSDFIKDYYIDELNCLISEEHYFVAFLVISSGIEFLGKAISGSGWSVVGKSKRDFNKALRTFKSLRKYSKLGLKQDGAKSGDSSLYSIVRCGIVHFSCPGYGITLTDEGDALPHEIGIKDFSSDFIAACNDLLNGKVSLGKGKALADIICYIG